jgi:uncharacterized protein (TIGR03067 family)
MYCLLIALQATVAHASVGDLDKLQGKWEIVRLSVDASGSAADYLMANAKGAVLIIRNNRCGMEGSDKGFPVRLSIDPSKSPKHLDIEVQDGEPGRGIYKLEGEQLTVCLAGSAGNRRPIAFEVRDGAFTVVLKKKRSWPTGTPK